MLLSVNKNNGNIPAKEMYELLNRHLINIVWFGQLYWCHLLINNSAKCNYKSKTDAKCNPLWEIEPCVYLHAYCFQYQEFTHNFPKIMHMVKAFCVWLCLVQDKFTDII